MRKSTLSQPDKGENLRGHRVRLHAFVRHLQSVHSGLLLTYDEQKIFLLFRRNPVDSAGFQQSDFAPEVALDAPLLSEQDEVKRVSGVSHASCENLYTGAMG